VEDRVHGEKGNDLVKGVLVPGVPEVADGGSGHNTTYLALPTRPSGKPWHHVLVDLLHGRLDADGSVTHFSGLFTDLLVLTHQTATDWAVKGTNEADDLSVFDAAGQQVVVEGRAGDDLPRTGAGDDVLRGGAGSDQGEAGAGTDACFSIEPPVDCEATSP
jgi:Ca2+-binding RTX toxin-like protein